MKTKRTKRIVAIALGLGLLLASQLACESTGSNDLTCAAPLTKTCTTDQQTGVVGCWCQ